MIKKVLNEVQAGLATGMALAFLIVGVIVVRDPGFIGFLIETLTK